jgi:hypothetical protein
VALRLLRRHEIAICPAEDLVNGSGEQETAGTIGDHDSMLVIFYEDGVFNDVESGTQDLTFG